MPTELSKKFVRAYDRLPLLVQKRVDRVLRLLDENWRHPGLRARRLSGHRDIFYARVDREHRITYERRGDVLVLRNVGSHDETLKNP
jgi:mRNA-degrading endonuclease YafQ of YafQ-DinJ toxin-antitoxin module